MVANGINTDRGKRRKDNSNRGFDAGKERKEHLTRPENLNPKLAQGKENKQTTEKN